MKYIQLTIHGYDATRFGIARKQNARWDECLAKLGPSKDGTYVVRVFEDKRGELPDIVHYQLDHSPCEGPVEFDYLSEPYVFYPPGKPSLVCYRQRWTARGFTIARYEPLNEVERARRAESRKTAKQKRENEAWNAAHPLFAGAQ